MLQAMRTQFEELRSRLLVHFPFEFNETAAGAGKKASRKRKVKQKSALEQLALVHRFAMHTSFLCTRLNLVV